MFIKLKKILFELNWICEYTVLGQLAHIQGFIQALNPIMRCYSNIPNLWFPLTLILDWGWEGQLENIVTKESWKSIKRLKLGII